MQRQHNHSTNLTNRQTLTKPQRKPAAGVLRYVNICAVCYGEGELITIRRAGRDWHVCRKHAAQLGAQ